MKTFLTLFVLLFSSSVVAEDKKLFCADTQVGGYDGDSNYSELKTYNNKKFTINVNIEEELILGDEVLLYPDTAKCRYISSKSFGEYDSFMFCSDYFTSFTINLNNYNYVRTFSFGYVMSKEDDISIGYGTCEKF